MRIRRRRTVSSSKNTNINWLAAAGVDSSVIDVARRWLVFLLFVCTALQLIDQREVVTRLAVITEAECCNVVDSTKLQVPKVPYSIDRPSISRIPPEFQSTATTQQQLPAVVLETGSRKLNTEASGKATDIIEKREKVEKKEPTAALAEVDGSDDDDAVAMTASPPKAVHNESVPIHRVPKGVDKPYLIIHLGPPKTATTSLQTDMYAFRNILAKDSYYVAGRFYDPFLNFKGTTVIQNRMSTPLLDEFKDLFKNQNCPKAKASCLDRVKQELKPFRGKHHVLLSDEGLAKIWNEKPGAYTAIRDALAADWNILILSAYRHFFEWVPSFKFQLDRLDKQSKKKHLWPGEVDGTSTGRVLQPLIPNEARHWISNSRAFTNNAIEASNGAIPVKVFDIHERGNSSIRTHFFCNVVPDAHHACAHSREMDKTSKGETIMNVRDSVTDTSYDMLTTAAAERGWIDTQQYQRKTIREALREYNENVLHQTHKDLDWICPNATELKIWLEGSLERQRATYGKLTQEMKEEHRQRFQEMVEAEEFCNVDTDAVLRKPIWKKFFASYAPPKKKPAKTTVSKPAPKSPPQPPPAIRSKAAVKTSKSSAADKTSKSSVKDKPVVKTSKSSAKDKPAVKTSKSSAKT